MLLIEKKGYNYSIGAEITQAKNYGDFYSPKVKILLSIFTLEISFKTGNAELQLTTKKVLIVM